MCEVEANAILQQRYTMMLRHPSDGAEQTTDHEDDKARGEIVLMSRKRQAKIVFRLEEHRARAHCA